MTWNIKTGGGTRLAAIRSVIADVRPDVLLLQELKGWRANRIDGFQGFLSPSVFGQPVAVLTRLPVSRPRSVRLRLHHAAASVTVATGAGPLTVVSTHLNPFSPQRRYREARWLTARFGSRRRMVLLGGDLNSLDPGTDHTAALDRLPTVYRHRHAGPDGTVDTRAIAAFLAGGFTDLWGGTPDGETAPTTGEGGREFSGMRLDYLLASRALAGRAGSIRVVRGGAAEHASDHYPVVAELDL